MVKIALFGSTGDIGKTAVSAALDAGHRVVAVARNVAAAEKLFGSRNNLTIVQGAYRHDTCSKSMITCSSSVWRYRTCEGC